MFGFSPKFLSYLCFNNPTELCYWKESTEKDAKCFTDGLFILLGSVEAM